MYAIRSYYAPNNRQSKYEEPPLGGSFFSDGLADPETRQYSAEPDPRNHQSVSGS